MSILLYQMGTVGGVDIQPELIYQDTGHTFGSSPFNFTNLSTGDLFTDRRLVITVAGNRVNSVASPTLSVSVDGGAALTPLASHEGSRVAKYLYVIEDASSADIDVDVTSNVDLDSIHVDIYSAGDVALVDSLGSEVSTNTHSYTGDVPAGGSIVGIAVGRTTSGAGGNGTASTHYTSAVTAEEVSVTRSSGSAPDGLDWTGLTENSEGDGSNANIMSSLFVVLGPAE